jgi:hypothetical protein
MSLDSAFETGPDPEIVGLDLTRIPVRLLHVPLCSVFIVLADQSFFCVACHVA